MEYEITEIYKVISWKWWTDVWHLWVWVTIVVMFCYKWMTEMYMAQITEKEPSIEANFATRVGSAFTFHWLNFEYESYVIVEEVYQFIPPSVLNRQRILSLMYVPVCVMCVNIWRNIHKYLNPFFLIMIQIIVFVLEHNKLVPCRCLK